MLRFPLNLVWLGAVTVLSFLCIERPFNELRTRLETRVFDTMHEARPLNPLNLSSLDYARDDLTLSKGRT